MVTEPREKGEREVGRRLSPALTLPVACGGGPPSGLHGCGAGDGMYACVQRVLLHLSPGSDGCSPSSLLSARQHMSLARAMAASAEGDMKELLAWFPAGQEARRVLRT